MSMRPPVDLGGIPRRRTEEWIGALFPLPEGLLPELTARPNVGVWIEGRTGLMLGYGLLAPDAGTGPFGELFVRTIATPAVGRPRRPGRVRVADELLASELRSTIDGVQVIVAPTPEIEALKDAIHEYLAPSAHRAAIADSYLEDSAVTE